MINTHDKLMNFEINSASGGQVTGNAKTKISLFIIHVKGNWNDLNNKIKVFNEVDSLNKLDTEHIKVHCKNDNDFQKNQSFLDSNFVAYTNLSFGLAKNVQGKFVFVRSFSPYTTIS